MKRPRRAILTPPQGEKMRQKRLNALTLSLCAFFYFTLYDVDKMQREIDEKRKEAARTCTKLKEERREYRARAIKRLEVEGLGASFFLDRNCLKRSG